VDWDDVRVLLALFRAKSLEAAARQLGLDASTVSRRLARLEEKVEARLFTRTRDGMRATLAAERMRLHAEAMEREAAALARAAVIEEQRARGLVRVATTDALARLLVAEGLLDVQREHPSLILELSSENRPVDLARGDADIAIRLAALKQPSLRARLLASMGVGLFAGRAYLDVRGRPRATAALAGHDVLLPTGDLARLPEARWLASRAAVRVRLRANGMGSLVAAAIAGYGIVPLPVGWGDSEPELERLFVLDAVPRRKVWLVTHESTAERPSVAVVSRQIASIFERVFPR
jgi:DNA-binding transcriptional LysR family regulator